MPLNIDSPSSTSKSRPSIFNPEMFLFWLVFRKLAPVFYGNIYINVY
ncbi:hypothetical protein C1G87_0333 [Dehalococcoides mccartyi]|uniref:Uncharacterized protein n=1 Tax=Dehalococcoides mccartyi TaxID=61435 RepID=A0A328ELC0_9CHLR|nr:hypothetical protein C1G87_0333 [Dehalococcoides mccartyi]